MNLFRVFFHSASLRVLSSAAIIISLTLGISQNLQAAEQWKTLFLPLKITSFTQDPELTLEADRALTQALSLKGQTLLSRSEAEKRIDYQADWPPTSSTLVDIELFKKYESLAVGSLTVLGNQLSLDIKLYDLLSPNNPKYYTAQGRSLKELDAIFYNVVNEILAYTDRESIIASIAPAGNRKIDSGAILKNIATKPGDYYNPAGLRQDLKSIYKMGYFDDVQIEVNQGPKGKEVLFRIVEKPIIRSISYSGLDELDEEAVREVVTIEKQSILNPAQINRASEAIQLLYKSKGYYNTKVTPKISFPSKESAEVRFVVDEGKKVYIKEIRFEGNNAFDDDDLEDEIESDTKGWLSWITESGLMDYDKLNQDAGRIINFYGNHGFLEAKIGDPQVTQEEEWLYITFVIEEGSRFKVGKVDIAGDLLEDKFILLETLTITNEEYISRKVLRDDILQINDFYAERGYANANVRPAINPSETNKEKLDITIQVDKGELVYINRINIRGNNRTRDNVIRRELDVAEGGIFNATAMRGSVQKLQYLEFFADVSITPEQSFDKSAIDLTIEVEEKSTGTFTIGAGYSSVDSVILMGEIAENNFLGRGDTLALSANVGGSSNRYNLRYNNPHIYDSALSGGFDFFNTYREYDDYTKDSQGGAISFGYPVWRRWRGFGSYSYTNTDLSDVAEDASYVIRESQDINVTSAIKLTLQRDSRDKRFGASRGSRNVFSVKYAGGPLGGDSQFTKVEAETAWFFPLFWKTVFSVRGSAGQVFENEDGGLPVYERFYLGGLNSVRGFDYADISPVDPVTGEKIGGDKMWFTNFEFSFPLLTEYGVTGVVFYDMGNVYNDDEDWDFANHKKAAGAGIRWFSPMGPLRLEWGYNLDPSPTEEESVWDFSVGGIF